MGQDAYLYVVCDGVSVCDPTLSKCCAGVHGWYVKRWPYVFRLLTGRSRESEGMPEPIVPPRGLPSGWTTVDFERLTGYPLDLLDTEDHACLTWYALAELQAARDRHPYLSELVTRIESATPNPATTRVIVWVDN